MTKREEIAELKAKIAELEVEICLLKKVPKTIIQQFPTSPVCTRPHVGEIRIGDYPYTYPYHPPSSPWYYTTHTGTGTISKMDSNTCITT